MKNEKQKGKGKKVLAEGKKEQDPKVQEQPRRCPALMECTTPTTLCGVEVACGRCAACRDTRSREWTIRLRNELESWTDSCFLTLTYAEENMPEEDSLEPKELRDFLKRFRKETNAKIRYYAIGEYGSTYGRPHYHLIIFGLSHTWEGFVHLYPRSTDQKLSQIVECKSWTHGFAHVGSVTPDSIKYVTDYVTTKLTGQLAVKVYGQREPPFQRVSKGIGEQFVLKNAEALTRSGSIVSGSARLSLPRYYKKKLDIKNYTISKLLEGRALMRATVKRAMLIHQTGTLDPEILKKEELSIKAQQSKNLIAKKSQKARSIE